MGTMGLGFGWGIVATAGILIDRDAPKPGGTYCNPRTRAIAAVIDDLLVPCAGPGAGTFPHAISQGAAVAHGS